jgi:hypothetical protein
MYRRWYLLLPDQEQGDIHQYHIVILNLEYIGVALLLNIDFFRFVVTNIIQQFDNDAFHNILDSKQVAGAVNIIAANRFFTFQSS